MAINADILDLLADPLTKDPLSIVRGADGVERLHCVTNGLYYPIDGEIPVLLAEEAQLEDGSPATDLVAEIRERISQAGGEKASN